MFEGQAKLVTVEAEGRQAVQIKAIMGG